MAKLNSVEVAAWPIFSLPFCVLPLLFMPSPFGGLPDSCMVFFPWASHTASHFCGDFCCPIWGPRQLLPFLTVSADAWNQPCLVQISATRNKHLKSNVCWENTGQKVKVNTWLSCKFIWYHALIKGFYWEGTDVWHC